MWQLWLGITFLTLICLASLLYPLHNSAIKLRQHTFAIIIISAIFPLLAISLYTKVGHSHEWQTHLVQQQKQQQVEKFLAQYNNDPQQLIIQLKKHLQQKPEAKGSYLLGKLYESMQQYQQATAALKQAYTLEPLNLDITFEYAQALFLLNKHLNTEAQQILAALLQHQPNHINALSLLALDAYTQKNYPKAIQYWQAILPHIPQDDAAYAQLQQAITQAQQQQDNTAKKNNSPRIEVNIQIPAIVLKKLDKNANLFVIAKAIQGPSIPLAVAKLKLTSRTHNYRTTLTDQSAMLPNLFLSQFTEVEIYALISANAKIDIETKQSRYRTQPVNINLKIKPTNKVNLKI